jgi:hypothetical protein
VLLLQPINARPMRIAASMAFVAPPTPPPEFTKPALRLVTATINALPTTTFIHNARRERVAPHLTPRLNAADYARCELSRNFWSESANPGINDFVKRVCGTKFQRRVATGGIKVK